MKFFDITRLCKRANAPAPSGIDRVDLAYLRWLRKSGPVDYLVNGMSGFTQIARERGDAFLTAIESIWHDQNFDLDFNRFGDLQDTSHRYRMASKWWARRRKLDTILSGHSLIELCRLKEADLNLLDASAHSWAYRVDPGWKKSDKSGHYFGISHSMLSRTAYMAALAKNENLKRVLFIHDTIPCDFPEYCRGDERTRHLLRIRNAFRYGTHIVVNSEYTKQRLDYWRAKLGEKEIPVEVIPIGVDESLMHYSRSPSDIVSNVRPYFVVLGTIEPRKNHALLLDIWKSFADRLPKDAIPELLIIGKRGWENEAVFRTLDNCSSLRGHVREMNNVSDQELWPLLQGALAMLFPSHVEGWGMPMVEALTLGVPVIASDIPAFKEAGQGVPDLICPSNQLIWEQHILNYAVHDSGNRLEQLKRLNNFRPPTWSDHFSTVQIMIGLGDN